MRIRWFASASFKDFVWNNFGNCRIRFQSALCKIIHNLVLIGNLTERWTLWWQQPWEWYSRQEYKLTLDATCKFVHSAGYNQNSAIAELWFHWSQQKWEQNRKMRLISSSCYLNQSLWIKLADLKCVTWSAVYFQHSVFNLIFLSTGRKHGPYGTVDI